MALAIWPDNIVCSPIFCSAELYSRKNKYFLARHVQMLDMSLAPINAQNGELKAH